MTHSSTQNKRPPTTDAATPPNAPGPHLHPGPLPGDFYAYQGLLSDPEKATVGRLREFLRTAVAPIVDDYWARAEFPFELFDGLAKLGLTGWADPASTEPKPSNLLQGMIAMELAHADASVATGFGVHTGLAMGSILTCGCEEQQRRWLSGPITVPGVHTTRATGAPGLGAHNDDVLGELRFSDVEIGQLQAAGVIPGERAREAA